MEKELAFLKIQLDEAQQRFDVAMSQYQEAKDECDNLKKKKAHIRVFGQFLVASKSTRQMIAIFSWNTGSREGKSMPFRQLQAVNLTVSRIFHIFWCAGAGSAQKEMMGSKHQPKRSRAR